MGRSFTPTFRIETEGGDGIAPMCWNSREMGRPSEKNLEAVLVGYAKSCEIGGVNEAISRMLGRLPKLPRVARVVRQTGDRAGEVVAEWKCPMFMVL